MTHYVGIQREDGKVIPEKQAFSYALCRVIDNPEERNEFIQWFYSGNWIKEETESEAS